MVNCDGATKGGYTQYYGLEVDCAQAPTAVALALRMFGLAPQRIDVASRAGADKVYVFEFEPGDLGKRKFTAQRLQIGYFAQHQVEQLREDESPLWHLARIEPQTREQELRDFLEARSLGAASVGEGRLRMLVTDRPQSFAEVASRFLGHPVDEVEQIDL